MGPHISPRPWVLKSCSPSFRRGVAVRAVREREVKKLTSGTSGISPEHSGFRDRVVPRLISAHQRPAQHVQAACRYEPDRSVKNGTMASRRPRAVVLASVALLSSSFVLRKSPPLRGARTSPAPARAAHRPPAHAREPRALYTRCYADASSRSDNGTRDDEFNVEPPKRKEETTALALTEDASTNPYYKVVASLSPGEIIGRFAATAPPRVQDAVKQTIMGLLGNAGSFALETATVTTSEKLANLMFQLQMTGYMFKNAEYRISLSESLADVPALPPGEAAAVDVVR